MGTFNQKMNFPTNISDINDSFNRYNYINRLIMKSLMIV